VSILLLFSEKPDADRNGLLLSSYSLRVKNA